MKIDNIQKLLDECPLETTVRISLQMADYDNWDNGDYNGDPELTARQVEAIIFHIEEWVSRGMINPIRKIK